MTVDFACGIHSVCALLNLHADKILTLMVQQDNYNPRLQELVKIAIQKGVKIQFVNRKILNQKSVNAHQGIIAIIESLPEYQEADLYLLLDKLTNTFLLFLDGITDPGNLGACLRTAQGAGVHAVIIPVDKSAPLNSVARKAACGATENLPIFKVVNLARTMKKVKAQGVWLIGTATDAQQTLYATDLSGNIGIIMGAEGKGLRQLTRQNCDMIINIPIIAGNSVNVSVATGICLFEAVRQRLKVDR